MKLFGIELGTISLLVAFSWFVSFGKAVLPTHLIDQGLTIPQIFFGSFLLIVGQLILLIAIGFKQRTYSLKLVWTIAIILYVVFFILSSFKIASLTQYYIASLIGGIASCLFYLFYNIRYFSEQKEGKTYSHSAKFFNILIIISLIAPFLAGIIGSLNFIYVAILTLLFFVIALIVARSLPNSPYSFSMEQSYKSAYGAKAILFLNGIYDSLSWGILTVFTLRFIQTPFSFGVFGSYIAIVSIFSNFLIGRLGDTLKKGQIVVLISSILTAGAIILLGFSSDSLPTWIIANGIMQFISPIFASTTLALSLDRSTDKLLMLHAREVLINSGRFLGLGFAGIMIYLNFGGLWLFIVPALASLLLGYIALNRVK